MAEKSVQRLQVLKVGSDGCHRKLTSSLSASSCGVENVWRKRRSCCSPLPGHHSTSNLHCDTKAQLNNNREMNSQLNNLTEDTQEKHLTEDTQEKHLTEDTQEKHLTEDTQEKHNLTEDTQEKHLTEDTQEKHLTEDTQEKHLTEDTQEKHNLTEDTQEKHLTEDTQEKHNLTEDTQEKQNLTEDTHEMHHSYATSGFLTSSSLPLLLGEVMKVVGSTQTLPLVSHLKQSEEASLEQPLTRDIDSPDRCIPLVEVNSHSSFPVSSQLQSCTKEHLKYMHSGIWKLQKIPSESFLTKERPHKPWASLFPCLSCPSLNDTQTEPSLVDQLVSPLEEECLLENEMSASLSEPVLELKSLAIESEVGDGDTAIMLVCNSQSADCVSSPYPSYSFAHSFSCPSLRTWDCPWLSQWRENLHVRRVRFASSVAIQSIPEITPSGSDTSADAVSSLAKSTSYLNLRTMEEVQLRDTILYGQCSAEVSADSQHFW